MGKEIVDREIYYSRLRAAVYTRDQLQSDMMIIARTDAAQKYGFDEAIERLNEAVKIGVDIVFFEALKSKEEAIKGATRFMDLHRKHWPGWEGETEIRQIFGPEDFAQCNRERAETKIA